MSEVTQHNYTIEGCLEALQNQIKHNDDLREQLAAAQAENAKLRTELDIHKRAFINYLEFSFHPMHAAKVFKANVKSARDGKLPEHYNHASENTLAGESE